mgnify:CR=1 FL=1
MNEKISIIVPVYNAEKYIEKCIKSILNQSYTDIELLLVDDGSTDGSLSIIRSWEKKDKRIKVIQQENRGASAARNAGMRGATGQFIQFFDADDTVEFNCCEEMLKAIGDNDLCVCGIEEIVNEKITRTRKPDLDQAGGHKAVMQTAYTLYDSDLLHSLCNKLYRKNCIAGSFPEDMTMGEDLLFNLEYLKNCKGIYILPMCLYRYVRNSRSATRKFRKNMSCMQCRIYENLYAFFDEMPAECKNNIDMRFFEHMVQLVFKRAIMSRGELREDRIRCVKEGLKNRAFKDLMKRYRPENLKELIWMFLLKTRFIYLVIL